MKRFIDNVSVQVIEMALVSSLANILSPLEVYRMKPELVARVAGESKENQVYREQLANQLDVLGKGAEICEQFDIARHSSRIIVIDSR